MKKINIAGYEFNNFGSNNYSNGMQLITSTDRPLEIIEKVKLQEPGFECVWFNPSAPSNDSEFFGVLGTEEQYSEFYKRQREAQIAELLLKRFGSWAEIAHLDNEEFKEAKEEIEASYKDWWEK